MRIALLAQDFPPRRGGTQAYNVEFATRLAERGHDVRVLTWQAARDPAAEATFPFELQRRSHLRGRGLDVSGMREMLTGWKSEVALVSGGCATVGSIVKSAAREVPVVVAVHDVRERGSGYGLRQRWRQYRRYGWERAERLIANSEDTRRRLIRLGVAPERISIVHPGVDTERFTPDPAAAARLRRETGLLERPLLLTVARLSGNKGHARVVRALPALRREFPDVAYAIVGTGRHRERLEALAAELGVAEAVHFAGDVPDPRPWYQACDVYAMPSTPPARGLKPAEGFGIAYLEAAACGAPAIASSSGGGPEIVVEGVTGRVVDPNDDDQLLGALRELLQDRARSRAMGARAREHVLRFDWRHGTEALEQVLRDVTLSTR